MNTIARIIGTGGIGSGIIYKLQSNADLGRNETRMASRLPQRDFCKAHIILHYLAVLLKELRVPIQVSALGAVGRDEVGTELLRLMKEAGICTEHVARDRQAATLFAVCYQFPDGSGGNLTELRSASDRLNVRSINRIAAEVRASGAKCVLIAAPEVSLECRQRLLEIGRRHQAFNVLSCIEREAGAVKKRSMLELTDLLAINIGEAAVLGEVSAKARQRDIVESCVATVSRRNPKIMLSITAGADGCYGYHAKRLRYLPALRVPLVNTAGAGDAFLSGLVLGLVRHLPFINEEGPSCLHLGRLLSALKVTAADTINFEVNLRTLKKFARRMRQPFPQL